jgi:hypothetical protein
MFRLVAIFHSDMSLGLVLALSICESALRLTPLFFASSCRESGMLAMAAHGLGDAHHQILCSGSARVATVRGQLRLLSAPECGAQHIQPLLDHP